MKAGNEKCLIFRCAELLGTFSFTVLRLAHIPQHKRGKQQIFQTINQFIYRTRKQLFNNQKKTNVEKNKNVCVVTKYAYTLTLTINKGKKN